MTITFSFSFLLYNLCLADLHQNMNYVKYEIIRNKVFRT